MREGAVERGFGGWCILGRQRQPGDPRAHRSSHRHYEQLTGFGDLHRLSTRIAMVGLYPSCFLVLRHMFEAESKIISFITFRLFLAGRIFECHPLDFLRLLMKAPGAYGAGLL